MRRGHEPSSQLEAVADAVQEFLAAGVQRDVGATSAPRSLVSTTCAETRAIVEQPFELAELAVRRGAEGRA